MPEFVVRDVDGLPYVYVEGRASMQAEDISAAMGAAFGRVMAVMQAAGVESAGPALAVYDSYESDDMQFRAGFVVAEDDLDKVAGQVGRAHTPAGRAVCFQHVGPYAELQESYAQLMDYLAAQGLEMGVPCVELYLDDPGSTPENRLRTEIRLSLA